MRAVAAILAIALTLLIAGAEASDTSCFARGGKCIPKYECKGKALSGRVCNGLFCCPGSTNCCVPKDTSCTARGGSCMPKEQCGRSYLSGKVCNGKYCCPGSSNCCVGPLLRGKPAPKMSTNLAKCIGIPSNKAASYSTGIQNALNSFGMDDAEEVAVFLANCAVESGYWKTMTEYGCYKNGANYQGGCRYKGRGIIQITHRDNFAALGRYFAQDFVAHPEKVSTTEWGFKSAAWFWMHYANIDHKCFDPKAGSKFYQRDVQCRRKCAAAIINGYYRSNKDSCGIRDPHGWVPRKDQYHRVAACVEKAMGAGGPHMTSSSRSRGGINPTSTTGSFYRRLTAQQADCLSASAKSHLCTMATACPNMNDVVAMFSCKDHNHAGKDVALHYQIEGGPNSWSASCSSCELINGPVGYVPGQAKPTPTPPAPAPAPAHPATHDDHEGGADEGSSSSHSSGSSSSHSSGSSSSHSSGSSSSHSSGSSSSHSSGSSSSSSSSSSGSSSSSSNSSGSSSHDHSDGGQQVLGLHYKRKTLEPLFPTAANMNAGNKAEELIQ